MEHVRSTLKGPVCVRTRNVYCVPPIDSTIGAHEQPLIANSAALLIRFFCNSVLDLSFSRLKKPLALLKCVIANQAAPRATLASFPRRDGSART